ncbi:MAG: glycosyltransferase involved in cell wall biosynthesis [Bacteroidia bacterium]|jgi:glycosyltransferase involved in cell wall biosynthesis
MKVALDYFAAATHGAGIGRYGREFVRALVREQACPDLRLLAWGRGAELGAEALGLRGADVVREPRRVNVRLPKRTADWFHTATGKGAESVCGDVQIFHRSAVFEPRLGRTKSKRPLMVQPLLELPPVGSDAESRLRSALGEMDAILCGSRAGAAEAAQRLGVPASKLHAVTTGADHWLRYAQPKTCAELEAAGPPRLLALGAISKMRQPRAVLAAFEVLVDEARFPGITLTFAGHPGDDASAFQAALACSPAASQVTWIQIPVEADFPQLVSSASVLVHLSEGELSPITPLEAITFGTAVVASDLPAFREVLTSIPGAELLPAGPRQTASASSQRASAASQDPEQLAQAIERAIESAFHSESRAARIQAASAHTWCANAKETLAIWQKLAASGA